MTQYSLNDLIKNKLVKYGNQMVLLLWIQVLSRQEEEDQAEDCLLQYNQDQKG
jgi:hypothetical protein